jgi:hypothetical protein
MGNFFTKKDLSVKPISNIDTRQRDPSHTDIKEIIQHYEHIKNTKNIKDINKLIDVMQNTNWDSTVLLPEPSAPPVQIYIPIAIARIIEPRVIEPSELIK